MFKQLFAGTAALLLAGASHGVLLSTVGESVVYNFGPAPSGVDSVYFSGHSVINSPPTVTIKWYSEKNLGGSLVYTDNKGADGQPDILTDARLLDANGFSLLFTLVAVDPNGSPFFDFNARVDWVKNGSIDSYSTGTLGDQSALVTLSPPPTSTNVPEPGTLLLVALAGLVLSTTRRRPAAT